VIIIYTRKDLEEVYAIPLQPNQKSSDAMLLGQHLAPSGGIKPKKVRPNVNNFDIPPFSAVEKRHMNWEINFTA